MSAAFLSDLTIEPADPHNNSFTRCQYRLPTDLVFARKCRVIKLSREIYALMINCGSSVPSEGTWPVTSPQS